MEAPKGMIFMQLEEEYGRKCVRIYCCVELSGESW